MAVSRTVLGRKGLVQSAHGATSQWEADNDANLAALDANVVYLADLPADAGFAPTAGAGLSLNVAAGKGFLNGALTSYAGGSLSLTASSTNYVYLDPGAGLQPAFNTTGFLLGQIPIAVVTTDGSSITNIADKRSYFMQTFGQFAAKKFLAGPTSGADAYPSPRVIAASDLPGAPASANTLLAGPTSGAAADPSFRALVDADMPADAILKLAATDLITQAADISSTALYSVPAGAAGLYRVTAYIVVTQVADTSSTLPKIAIAWTDPDNATAQTFDLTATDSGNLLTTLAQGSMIVSAKESTDISFSTSGYASAATTPMQFALHLRVERL